MKYLKTFESYREDINFFRFSHIDLLRDKDQSEFTPIERKMVESEEYNKVLVSLRFPNQKNCIHFMDEVAFDPSYKGIYGENIYQISIDDESRIGWSFFFPVNDWYYKGYPYGKAVNKSKELRDFESNTDFGRFSYLEATEEESISMARLLMENGFIGTGTLKDLMNSRFWGKENVFVWTNDKVIVSKYQNLKKTQKEPTPYKNQPALNVKDFEERGIDKSQIEQFYQSPQGKKMASIKTLKTELKREESLRLLDEWISSIS
jgi:hypothetical protein